jgi:hypothetical protein
MNNRRLFTGAATGNAGDNAFQAFFWIKPDSPDRIRLLEFGFSTVYVQNEATEDLEATFAVGRSTSAPPAGTAFTPVPILPGAAAFAGTAEKDCPSSVNIDDQIFQQPGWNLARPYRHIFTPGTEIVFDNSLSMTLSLLHRITGNFNFAAYCIFEVFE